MRKSFAALILIVLLMSLATCTGLAASVPWQWFGYSVHGRNRVVFSIAHDSRERAWIGTNTGLFLFDGYAFHPVTYADGSEFSAQVYATVETADGNLYVGANNGLFRLDADDLTVAALPGETPREIRALATDGDGVFVGSLNGLYRYLPDTGTFSDPVEGLPHSAVYSLLARDKQLYVGTYDGLCRLDSAGTVERVPLPASHSANTFVNALCADADGNLCVGLEDGLVLADDAGTYRRVAALDGNSVKALASMGAELAVASDNGLYVVASDGAVRTERHSAARNSIPSNVVWSLHYDNANVLWTGTELGLALADTGSALKVMTLAQLTGCSEGQQVYNICRDSRGRLWLGGTNGLIALNPDNSSRWYSPADPNAYLSHTRVRHILETDDAALWVATDGGLNELPAGSDTFVNHRVTHPDGNANANWAYGILTDSTDGTFWTAGFLGGVFVEDLARFRAEGTAHVADTLYNVDSGLPNTLIGQLIADAAGNKWVQHYRTNALTRIGAETREARAITLEPLSNAEPALICAAPDSTLWVAVTGAVMRLDADGNPLGPVIPLTFTPEDQPTALAMVGSHLWVATEQAVYEVDPETATAEMLPLPDKTYTAIYVDPVSRKVILGSVDCIVVVDHERLDAANDGTPELNVAAMRRGNDYAIAVTTSEINPGRYRRYAYRLDNGAWHLLPHGSNNLTLSDLSSGAHSLTVALAGTGVSTTVDLAVPAPWYLYLIAVVLLLGVAATAYFVRRRKAEQSGKQAAAIPEPAIDADGVGEEHRRMAAVTALIQANIDNPDLNVAFVCESTGLSTKTLYRMVKKHTGATPLDYIRRTRLAVAAALLSQGTYSVAEVMYKVGFNSSSYFSKCFAQQYGTTPGKYARPSDSESEKSGRAE